jgi:hypothetical protein
MVRAVESGYVNDTTSFAHTGATSQLVNSTKYLTDITQLNSQITMGNEDLFKWTEKGIYRDFLRINMRRMSQLNYRMFCMYLG